MIEGKEDGFARKRRTRDKANRRFLKNRHMIIPGLAGLAALGGMAGATVALSIGPALSPYGFIIGAAVAYAAGGWHVVRDLSE